MTKVFSKIIDKNILKVMTSYVFASKAIIISFILLLTLNSLPMLLFINSIDLEMVYIKNQIIFVISPFVTQVIFIMLLIVRTSVTTKNNNFDLYIGISNNTKFKILMSKQFTVFFIGLLTLLFPLVNTIILLSLSINVANNYFVTVFWILFQLTVTILIIFPIITITKTFVLSFSLTIFLSTIWILGIISTLFISSNKNKQEITNNYQLMTLNSKERAASSQNVIINFNDNNKFKNDLPITNYIPFIGLMGNSLSSTLVESDINQLQREKILNNGSNYSTINSKLIYDDPQNISISNKSIILPVLGKIIFDYKYEDVLFKDLEASFEKEINIKDKDNNFWRNLLNNLQAKYYISDAILTSEEKNILTKSVGTNNNLIKQLFIYKRHLGGTSTKFLKYLRSKKYPDAFIDYLKFMFLNEDTRFQIIKLDAIGLPSNYYYPDLSILNIYKAAHEYDIKYLSSILFKPSFDSNKNIVGVDYLNNKNFYSTMNDWETSLIIDNSKITNKSSWENYWKDNAEVTNLETIIFNSKNNFNDIASFNFSNNVFDKLAISKTYEINLIKKYNYLQLIYSLSFVAIAIMIQFFARYRLNRKDVL